MNTIVNCKTKIFIFLYNECSFIIYQEASGVVKSKYKNKDAKILAIFQKT
jgi:hypothetical protein